MIERENETAMSCDIKFEFMGENKEQICIDGSPCGPNYTNVNHFDGRWTVLDFVSRGLAGSFIRGIDDGIVNCRDRLIGIPEMIMPCQYSETGFMKTCRLIVAVAEIDICKGDEIVANRCNRRTW